MPTYKIRGIDVDFPFEAYDSQIVYMDKVIQSLQEKCNALLESPTGTGKTLCLLCATLAWRKKDKNEISLSQSELSGFSTIVYASRTHSQIRQVIQELKRTSYRPKMVVLGSREQLCIHDEVKLLQGKTQSNACRVLCRRRGKRHCSHFQQVTDYLKNNPHLGEEPVDIEDLVNIGRRFGPCPYYLSKELHKVVDIVFAPYNYLIDRGYRKSLQVSWSNSILIFDEAHNLEGICADAASFDLPSWLLTACISESEKCIDLSIERRDKSNDKSQNPDDFAILRALLLKLEKRIAEVPIESKELGYTKPGPYIYEMLADLNITHKTASKLVNIIAVASTLLEEHNQQKSTGTVCRLDRISEILEIVFRDGRTAHAKYYRVHVREVEARGGNGSKGILRLIRMNKISQYIEIKFSTDAPLIFPFLYYMNYSILNFHTCTIHVHVPCILSYTCFDAAGKVLRTLSWWCFNPGIAMEDFSRYGVRSIILTSGTLSPMESFAKELKLDFPIRLENPHVITPNQIWAGVVSVGPSGRTFNSSYRTRDSIEYRQELGNAIVNLARIVPDGLLVFFPSYYLLDQCTGCWKSVSNENSTSIWDRICKHKKPVIEPRDSSAFPMSIKDYMTKLNDTSVSGAVFFAVCRGKVSEGLDFADHAGRAVVITGLPFATSNDPKVRLKREYLDQQSRPQGELLKILTGDEWYNQQASRAVNQAVGRVIRHRYDYGAIIFCDERFSQPHRQSQVSRWIQPHIKCFSRFGEVVFTLSRFFRDVGTQGPTKVSLLEAESEASSLLDTKKGCISHLGEIVPANRSSLSSENGKTVHCESSRDISGKVLLGGKTLLSQKRDMVDLTDCCQLGEKSKDTPIPPCSAKKRRFVTGEYDLKQYFGNSNEHSSSGSQNAQRGVDLQHKDGVASNSLELIRQKSILPADSAPSVGDETQGSAFLAQLNLSVRILCFNCAVQVRDKLSAAEYIDFVGYMKALKTKAMKISEVLQCISRMFSGPERLPLLKRFKDYIPAKYHSLYEHYVEEKS
uniref:Regulator of telomere elongation helicase 1 homolog n=1 Tax=Cajanus cajan TaxID=3821 RepID=A0A151RWH7_CAJCA|nr:Regulator of telomere elongation helicase 1 [Cajanus cajan]